MFRPVPMLQFSAVVLDKSRRAVLKEWGRLGSVQLSRPVAPERDWLPVDNSSRLVRCEALLSRISALRQSLEIVEAPEDEAEPEELTPEEADQRLSGLEGRAGELLSRRERLERRWGELSALDAQVSSYCGLGLPLDEPAHSEFLHFVTGTLPAENLAQLQPGREVALLPLGIVGERQHLLAMTTHQGRLDLERALTQAGFEPEPLPTVAGATADSWSEGNRREEEAASAELRQVLDQVRQLGGEAARPLAGLERSVETERRLLEAEGELPRSATAVLLSGWIPAAQAPGLERRVREITANRCVVETTPAEELPEAQVPVLLQHGGWLRPFERLVAGYGLPTYRELEPTLFMAGSFMFMFGMMFGDVGHGAVLAGAGLVCGLTGRSTKLQDSGLLLLFGGLASMIFGLLYGSCFGLPQFKGYALWRDPLAGDPLTLLYTAMGVGVGMLSLGLLLNVLNHLRHGDSAGAWLDKFGLLGVVFYWGMLWLITHRGALRPGVVQWALLLFAGVPVAGWALRGPIEYVLRRRRSGPQPESLWAAGIESMVGAFEGLLSYLANTISFVRLAAYALSHAALLAATFMLAAQVQHASRAAGVLVVILGNLVALALEGVIATVQALRLEYYEFFGKFFSGSGRAFVPFRLPG